MSFDPAIVPFVVNGVLDPSYGVNSSLNILTLPTEGLYSYSDGTNYNIKPYGRLKNLMDASGTGILIAGPLGVIATRDIRSSGGTLVVTNGAGEDDNIDLAVAPSTTVQLVNLQANSTLYGTPLDTVRINAGDNIGVTVDETGFTITGSGGSGPSLNNAYVVTEEATDLPDSVNLGDLDTGLLKNTVTSSVAVLSRAVPATTLAANDYQAGNIALSQIAALTPSNGNFLYYNAGAWTVNSNVMLLNTNQTITGIKTFTPKTIFTNSIQIIADAGDEKFLKSDAFGNGTWTSVGPGTVTSVGLTSSTLDITGSPVTTSGAFTAELPETAVTAGSYTYASLTVDAFGRITDASSGAAPGTTVTTTTADATPTALATIAVASNTAVTINGTITARNTTGTINNVTGGRFTCSAINTAGTLTLAATPDTTVQSTSSATFNVVVSGTNLVVQVTGIAATAYSWSTTYTASAL